MICFTIMVFAIFGAKISILNIRQHNAPEDLPNRNKNVACLGFNFDPISIKKATKNELRRIKNPMDDFG